MEEQENIGSAHPSDEATVAPEDTAKEDAAKEDAKEKARQAAWELAERAGVASLAPGAAVAGELGWRLRSRLLADQLAASHGIMMKLARRANYAINNANCLGVGEWALDVQAARTADMAGRMIDRYRHGLEALDKLGRPEGDPEIWVAYTWANVPPITPEEHERRRAQARATMNRDRPGETPLSQAAQEYLAQARAEARRLTAVAGVEALAADGSSVSRPRLFVDELAVAHHMMMRLTGRADWQLTSADADKVDPARQERAINGLTGAIGRMMDRYRRGLLMLKRQESGPGPDRDPAKKITGMYWAGPWGYEPPPLEELEGNRDPIDMPVDSAPAIDQASRRFLAEPGARRGRLRHGNPSGDYLKAPRCGACTRAGACCGQPAMANGRCRFHGGKSTGPRSSAGLARARSARLVHGGRSAEVIELRAAATAIGRNIRWLTAGLKDASPAARRCRPFSPAAVLAGHGVDRRVFSSASVHRSHRSSLIHRRASGSG